MANIMAKDEYKQVIMVRKDLDLPKGKMAAQAAHASVEAVFRSPDEKVKIWREQGMKKIVVKVRDEKEMLKFNQMAKDSGLVTAVITDAGHTVVEPGTKTCCAVGPDKEKDVDKITGKLETY